MILGVRFPMLQERFQEESNRVIAELGGQHADAQRSIRVMVVRCGCGWRELAAEFAVHLEHLDRRSLQVVEIHQQRGAQDVVPGPTRERLLAQLDRRVHAASVDHREDQVAQHPGKLRLQRKASVRRIDGLQGLADPGVVRRQHGPAHREVRILTHQPFPMGDRLGGAVATHERVGEIVAEGHHGRVIRNESSMVMQRLIDLARLLQQRSKQIDRVEILRTQLHVHADHRHGFIDATRHVQRFRSVPEFLSHAPPDCACARIVSRGEYRRFRSARRDPRDRSRRALHGRMRASRSAACRRAA